MVYSWPLLIVSALSSIPVTLAVVNETRCAAAHPQVSQQWVPESWTVGAARGSLIWAEGSKWEGLPWRDDPSTANRGPQFGNGYVGSVASGPEFIQSLFCPGGNRAPISPTYAATLTGMRQVAMAMDMEQGVVRQLWVPVDTQTGGPPSWYVEQKTFAHEKTPHLVVSQFTLNNSKGSSAAEVSVAPPSPLDAATDTSKTCITWSRKDVLDKDYALLLGKMKNKKHKTSSRIVALTQRITNQTLSAPAGGSSHVVLLSSKYTNYETDDPLKAASSETRDTLKITQSLLDDHVYAFTVRRSPHGAPIVIEGNSRLALMANVSWYSLLNSAPRQDLPPMPMGISGLPTNGFNGRMFWDVDTWMAPSFVLWFPEVADTLTRFRLQELPIAEKCAHLGGLVGADYPWDLDLSDKWRDASVITNFDRCEGHSEIHIGGDISYFFWQQWQSTGNESWARNVAWPVMKSIADYYATRVSYNTSDDTYFYAHASGPDESGIGDRNGSVYVAVVAKHALSHAAALGAHLGYPIPKNWSSLSSKISVLVRENDTLPNSPHYWHPEFAGFHFGDHIKQADTMMLYYPLMYSMPIGILKNDLYSCTLGGLPTVKRCGFQQMTAMALIVAMHDVGQHSLAEAVFQNFTDQSTEGPFCMWMEQTSFSHDGQILPQTTKAPNYLTTPGNWLQSIWAGFAGLRLNQSRLELHSPAVLPNSTGLHLRNIQFRGSRLDIHVLASGSLRIALKEAGKVPLSISGPDGKMQPLSTDRPYLVDSAKGVTIIGLSADGLPQNDAIAMFI